jgi:hypothetical protein
MVKYNKIMSTKEVISNREMPIYKKIIVFLFMVVLAISWITGRLSKNIRTFFGGPVNAQGECLPKESEPLPSENPIVEYIVDPIVDFFDPVVSWVDENIIDPVVENVVEPVTTWVDENIIDPVVELLLG